MAVLLMTEPSGAMLPVGEADGAGKPPLPRPVGAHDDVFRGNAVQVPEALPEAGAAF